MKELNLLYMYPDMLELYGDIGNIKVLQYRMRKRGLILNIDTYSIEDKAPDFCSYDIIFAGGGADNEQSILSKDLIKYKSFLKGASKPALITGIYMLAAHFLGLYCVFSKLMHLNFLLKLFEPLRFAT